MRTETIKELETVAYARAMSMNHNERVTKKRRGIPLNHNETVTVKQRGVRYQYNETVATKRSANCRKRIIYQNHNETVTTKPQGRHMNHNETVTEKPKVLEWGTIIVMLIGIALGTGLLFGLIGTFFNLSPSMTTGGIGASVGIAASTLIGRRRAAIAAQKNN